MQQNSKFDIVEFFFLLFGIADEIDFLIKVYRRDVVRNFAAYATAG